MSGGEVILTDLKFQHRGTAMFPYLAYKAMGEGGRATISTGDVSWPALDAVAGSPFEPGAGEEALDDIRASVEDISSEEARAFSDELLAAGIRSLDGYHARRKLPACVLDGDHGFQLAAAFSDGSTVAASSRNIYPDAYHAVARAIDRFFAAHESYPERYPVGWREMGLVPESISVECGSTFRECSGFPYAKVEANTGSRRWSVVIADRYRELSAADASEYGDVADASDLRIHEVAAFLDAFGVAGRNGFSADGIGAGDDALIIWMSFGDDREFSFRGGEDDLGPGYRDVKREFFSFAEDYLESMR